jgi:malonyl CoA-acyl carrier protein transacylase/acyl carrier protein/NAD(P)-dependent dehydrogenase (short-subunit alcohol dehydrogenase family)
MLTLRLEADTEREFDSVLQSASHSLREPITRSQFRANSIYRAAAVGANEAELSGSVSAIRKAWIEGARVQSLSRHRAFLWDASRGRDRIGWVFPGQGSQYASVPQVISQDDNAAAFLKRFDATLTGMGYGTVTENLADPQKRLGRDVWWTQQWVLAVSSTLADALRRHGHSPDVTLGHSFGECGAALHSGVMSMTQAIRFAKLRSDAVVMTVRQSGQLLSVRGEPSQVRSVLTKHQLHCFITHQNAPNQTVIAGETQQIESAKLALSAEGYASVVIPVPAAFHTPWMAEAQCVLASGFGHETLRPPKHAFLSSTNTKYLAEPSEIRSALIEQLTHPVLYATSVQRMVNDGCGLLVEVGPSDVLTRLNIATVGTEAICVSLDSNVGSHLQRLRLIDLAVECVKGSRSENQVVQSLRSSINRQTVEHSQSTIKSVSNVEIIDVTSRARRTTEAELPATEGKIASPSTPTPKPVIVTAGSSRNELQKSVNSQDAARRFLVDIIVELTGYQPEVIDFEADLEAELGVDSIKKAQVIGELAEWASLELNLREMKLSDFNSLGDILSLVAGVELPEAVSPQAPVAISTRVIELAPSLDANQANVAHTAPSSTVVAADLATSIESLMIDFVVDQTGYDPEVIDLDADLESELGIDSIKKAQLLGELAEQYELRDVELGRLSLADFSNLRSILEFVIEHCDDTVAVHAQSVEPVAPTSEEQNFTVEIDSDFSVEQDDVFTHGQLIGSSKKKEIRNRLRQQLDHAETLAPDWLTELVKSSAAGGANGHSIPEYKPSARLIDGIAAGAGVHPASLYRYQNGSQKNGGSELAFESSVPLIATSELEVPSHGTCRFLLDVVRRDRRAGTPTMPTFHGDAIVVGDNPIAAALIRRLQQLGVKAHQLHDVGGNTSIDATLERIWSQVETPHLFLTTPHDKNSLRSLDAKEWKKRRISAILGVFRLCQLWMQRMIDLNQMNHASLVTATNGGGSMGLAGGKLESPESGGLAGLTKAMLIECWMRGFRETPMKVIEFAKDSTPDRFIDGIMRELAVPSYDEETIVDGDRRWTVRARYAPINASSHRSNQITSGGTWIVTGGGRGITAMTAMELAKRHDLKLVLLGTAPAPSLQPGMRERGCTNRSQLRRDVMLSAQQAGLNPIEVWRDTEKSLEIDITLAECERRGIDATYYSVDVSDASAVDEILSHVRAQQGPIRGVIHGAGAGQDSRFDRKRPDKVEKCIRAKVDGCMALAAATTADPLEWFVGFGSISGRFGANGHTDYSLANDMLAKCINRLSSDRPTVRCVTFHWHAWGDIGMAAKPEAKLALEMIGMQFMPADEGLRHFLNELEFGGDSPEVLITDRNYVRKFFPDIENQDSTSRTLPILDPTGKSNAQDTTNHVVTLDPVTDRFLKEHRVNDRPTLPFVIALEMMAEAALLASGDRFVTKCTSAQALQAIKFVTDDAMAVEVNASDPNGLLNHWTIKADLRRKDGRLVEEGRKYFEAAFVTAPLAVVSKLNLPKGRPWNFTSINYLPPGATVFHGEPLQTLREIAIAPGEALGRIAAPSPAHLGGENRPLSGWILPCAAMDGVLYAAAILAYHEAGKPSLPVSFDEIRIGRLPDPGEPLLTHIRAVQSDERGMILAADLAGQNGDLILSLHGYRINWIR